MIIEFNGKKPIIGANVFIAPTAVISGDVKIGDNSNIWFGAVVRGDMEAIIIGENTNIQDNVTVHTDTGFPTSIGNNVSIGHNAVIHGCKIGDNSLIAIHASVLSGAIIGENSVVAAGSVVMQEQEVDAYNLVVGTPAKTKKVLTEEQAQKLNLNVLDYLELSKLYQEL